MKDFGKAKIVVAGDTGVGKSAFVHLLCHNEALFNPACTVGCNVETMLFPKEDVQKSFERRTFLEFWDVGGCANHKNTRSIFFGNIDGIILVHDLTNKRSDQHLFRWLNELLTDSMEVVCHSANTSERSAFSTDFDFLELKRDTSHSSILKPPISSSIPVLVVGTKLDMIKSPFLVENFSNKSTLSSTMSRSSRFNSEAIAGVNQRNVGANIYSLGFQPFSLSTLTPPDSFSQIHGFREIRLNCNASNSLDEASENGRIVADFFRQVLRFKNRDSGLSTSQDNLEKFSKTFQTRRPEEMICQLPNF